MDGGNAKGLLGTILAMESCVALDRCSRRGLPRQPLPALLYLLHPCSRPPSLELYLPASLQVARRDSNPTSDRQATDKEVGS
jgi:hypothetical protein